MRCTSVRFDEWKRMTLLIRWVRKMLRCDETTTVTRRTASGRKTREVNNGRCQLRVIRLSLSFLGRVHLNGHWHLSTWKRKRMGQITFERATWEAVAVNCRAVVDTDRAMAHPATLAARDWCSCAKVVFGRALVKNHCQWCDWPLTQNETPESGQPEQRWWGRRRALRQWMCCHSDCFIKIYSKTDVGGSEVGDRVVISGSLYSCYRWSA